MLGQHLALLSPPRPFRYVQTCRRPLTQCAANILIVLSPIAYIAHRLLTLAPLPRPEAKEHPSHDTSTRHQRTSVRHALPVDRRAHLPTGTTCCCLLIRTGPRIHPYLVPLARRRLETLFFCPLSHSHHLFVRCPAPHPVWPLLGPPLPISYLDSAFLPSHSTPLHFIHHIRHALLLQSVSHPSVPLLLNSLSS